MNSQRVTELHQREDNNAREWGLMLGSPQDHLVRAPSNTPYLASCTRFVRSVDIPYAQTDNGAFTVAMLPNALQALAVSGAPTTVPVATAEISLVSPSVAPAVISAGVPDVTSGLLLVNTESDTAGTTNFQDLTTFDPLLLNRFGVIVDGVQNSTIEASLTGLTFSFGQYFQMSILRLIGGVTSLLPIGPVTSVRGGVWLSPTYTIPNTVTVKAVLITRVTSAGVTQTSNIDWDCNVQINLTNGRVPISGGSTNLSLTKSELVEAGRVTLQRCTAMSLLITNMAPPLTSGGELVMARTNFNVLENGGGAQAIMDTIKRLPEERYWRSGPIVDGGYSWWLPDELASYEPLPLGDTPPTENVLVAAGIMSAADGFVRVIATWIFEFYTPVQLFSRNYNCTYSQAHRDMFNVLAREKACSANAGHFALLAGLAAAAKTVHEFYQSHQKIIDPLVNRAARRLVSVTDAPKTQIQQTKNKNKIKNENKIGSVTNAPAKPPRKKKPLS